MASDEEFNAGVSTTASPSVKQVTTKISSATSTLASQEWVEQKILSANPTGTIIVWSTATAPTGYLICDGSAISRTTYSNLFAVIETIYGEGDGASTFNLPNFTNRSLWQSYTSEIGIKTEGSVPNITGVVNEAGNQWKTATGAFTLNANSGTNTHYAASVSSPFGFNFDASRSSAVYGNYSGFDGVVPTALNILFCIKY